MATKAHIGASYMLIFNTVLIVLLLGGLIPILWMALHVREEKDLNEQLRYFIAPRARRYVGHIQRLSLHSIVLDGRYTSSPTDVTWKHFVDPHLLCGLWRSCTGNSTSRRLPNEPTLKSFPWCLGGPFLHSTLDSYVPFDLLLPEQTVRPIAL